MKITRTLFYGDYEGLGKYLIERGKTGELTPETAGMPWENLAEIKPISNRGTHQTIRGLGRTYRRMGWTALSVGAGGKSRYIFFFDTELAPEQAVAAAKVLWPQITRRFDSITIRRGTAWT